MSVAVLVSASCAGFLQQGGEGLLLGCRKQESPREQVEVRGVVDEEKAAGWEVPQGMQWVGVATKANRAEQVIRRFTGQREMNTSIVVIEEKNGHITAWSPVRATDGSSCVGRAASTLSVEIVQDRPVTTYEAQVHVDTAVFVPRKLLTRTDGLNYATAHANVVRHAGALFRELVTNTSGAVAIRESKQDDVIQVALCFPHPCSLVRNTMLANDSLQVYVKGDFHCWASLDPAQDTHEMILPSRVAQLLVQNLADGLELRLGQCADQPNVKESGFAFVSGGAAFSLPSRETFKVTPLAGSSFYAATLHSPGSARSSAAVTLCGTLREPVGSTPTRLTRSSRPLPLQFVFVLLSAFLALCASVLFASSSSIHIAARL